MKIKINSWISTKTYKTKNGNSVTFIEDIKKSTYYFLKNAVSEVYNMLMEIKDVEKVSASLVNSNYRIKLSDFVYELQDSNIINADNNGKIQVSHKYLLNKIRKRSENYSYFEANRKEFLFQNNFFDSLYLELNYICNLKCKHCFNPKNNNEMQISFEQAKKIIDEACLLGVSEVILTGGECILNKDFLKIAAYVRKKYLSLVIFTNGQILYDDIDIFNEITNLYPSKIKISLYSMDSNVHDSITGVKGSWIKTINVIKKIRKKNIPVKISCPQMSYNYGSYKDVILFAKSLGADYNGSCLIAENDNEEVKLTFPQIEKYYSDVIDLNNIKPIFKKCDNYVCKDCLINLSISPNLDIMPCVNFKYIYGNYNNLSLNEIKDKLLPEFKKRFITKNLKECFKKEYCKFCTYCPTISSSPEQFMKKNDVLCNDAYAYYNAFKKLAENKAN